VTSGNVEVVGQDVQREVADDLGDLGVGDAGRAGGLDDGLIDGAAASGDGIGQRQQRGHVRVGGSAWRARSISSRSSLATFPLSSQHRFTRS
jgi:hypothetical protein